MTDHKEQITCIKFWFNPEKPASQTHKKAFCDGIIIRTQICERYSRFVSGHTLFQDFEHSGHLLPSWTHNQNIKRMCKAIHKDTQCMSKNACDILSLSYNIQVHQCILNVDLHRGRWQHSLWHQGKKKQLFCVPGPATWCQKRTETSLRLLPVPEDENQLQGLKIHRYHRDSSLITGGARQHNKTAFQKWF
jgi:hypothetical protein